jgi:hypothetical protein
MNTHSGVGFQTGRRFSVLQLADHFWGPPLPDLIGGLSEWLRGKKESI